MGDVAYEGCDAWEGGDGLEIYGYYADVFAGSENFCSGRGKRIQTLVNLTLGRRIGGGRGFLENYILISTLLFFPAATAETFAFYEDAGEDLGPTARGGAEVDNAGDVVEEVELLV